MQKYGAGSLLEYARPVINSQPRPSQPDRRPQSGNPYSESLESGNPTLKRLKTPQLEWSQALNIPSPVSPVRPHPQGTDSSSVTAQVTRYGYRGDSYQNHTATSAGSDHENIGNRNNRLERGVSVALPPMTARALGIDPKAGEYVEANIGGQWQKFRVDDTAGDHKNHRIDFYDPTGARIKIDGSEVQVRKYGAPSKPSKPSNLSFSSQSARQAITSKGGMAILMDSNQASGVPVISPRIVIPDNATKTQRRAAQAYVDGIAKMQKEKFGRTLKPRVLTRSENKRGRSHATHLEGFSVDDHKFVAYIRSKEGKAWYQRHIQSTVGAVPNSKIFLPHSSKDPGAVNKRHGWSEVSLAREVFS